MRNAGEIPSALVGSMEDLMSCVAIVSTSKWENGSTRSGVAWPLTLRLPRGMYTGPGSTRVVAWS